MEHHKTLKEELISIVERHGFGENEVDYTVMEEPEDKAPTIIISLTTEQAKKFPKDYSQIIQTCDIAASVSNKSVAGEAGYQRIKLDKGRLSITASLNFMDLFLGEICKKLY